MTGYIYRFVNKTNGKSYVGKTSNLKERLRVHKTRSILQHTKFGAALRKYGYDGFVVETLIVVKKITDITKLNTILNNLEKYFIKKFDSCRNGYNITLGGDGTLGLKVSDETKAKISSTHKQNMTSERYERLSNMCRSIGSKTHITEELRNKAHKARKKQVAQFDLNETLICIHDSIREAALCVSNSINASKYIVQVCKGNRETYKHYKWAYIIK